MIELSILEHWYAVIQGHESWSTPAYFYPVDGALGYNDAYATFGLIYCGQIETQQRTICDHRHNPYREQRCGLPAD